MADDIDNDILEALMSRERHWVAGESDKFFALFHTKAMDVTIPGEKGHILITMDDVYAMFKERMVKELQQDGLL